MKESINAMKMSIGKNKKIDNQIDFLTTLQELVVRQLINEVKTELQKLEPTKSDKLTTTEQEEFIKNINLNQENNNVLSSDISALQLFILYIVKTGKPWYPTSKNSLFKKRDERKDKLKTAFSNITIANYNQFNNLGKLTIILNHIWTLIDQLKLEKGNPNSNIDIFSETSNDLNLNYLLESLTKNVNFTFQFSNLSEKVDNINKKKSRSTIFLVVAIVVIMVGLILALLSLPVFALSNSFVFSSLGLPLLVLGLLLFISVAIIRRYFSKVSQLRGTTLITVLGLSLLTASLVLGFAFPFILQISVLALLVMGAVGGGLIIYAASKEFLQLFREKRTWGSVALIMHVLLMALGVFFMLSSTAFIASIALLVFTYSFVALSAIVIENIVSHHDNKAFSKMWTTTAILFGAALIMLGVLNILEFINLPPLITLISPIIGVFFILLTIVTHTSPQWFKAPLPLSSINNTKKKHWLNTDLEKIKSNLLYNRNNNNLQTCVHTSLQHNTQNNNNHHQAYNTGQPPTLPATTHIPYYIPK